MDYFTVSIDEDVDLSMFTKFDVKDMMMVS